MKITRAFPEENGWGGYTAEELADTRASPSLRILRATRALAAAQRQDMVLLPIGLRVLPYFEIGDRVRFSEPVYEDAVFAERGKTGVVTDYSAEEYSDGWQLSYCVRPDEVVASELVEDGRYRGYQLALVKRADNAPFWRKGDDLARAEHKAWLEAGHPEITHKMWLLANYPEHPDNLQRPNASAVAPSPGATYNAASVIRAPLNNILPSFVPVQFERGIPGYAGDTLIPGEGRIVLGSLRALFVAAGYIGAMNHCARLGMDQKKVSEALTQSVSAIAGLTAQESQTALALIDRFTSFRVIRAEHALDDWVCEALWPAFQTVPYSYPSAMSRAIAYGLTIDSSLQKCVLEY